MNGILLIATNYPYYGRTAYNLAATIKATEPEMQIAVVHSGRALSHLTPAQLRIFDFLIEADNGDEMSVGMKLEAYELSPFDRTLFIDADNLWLPNKKPSELFAELEGIPFTSITEGYYDVDEGRHDIRPDYFLWADPVDIIEKYGITKGKIYQWRSEVFYFERSERVEAFFKTARAVFANPQVNIVKFAGTVPDELAFNIAANIHGIEPHVYKWNPTYWDKSNQQKLSSLGYINTKYWILSTGGNYQSEGLKKIYTTLVSAACKKLGVQHLFQLQPKRKVMIERQTL